MSDRWSLGLLLGLPAAVLIAVLCGLGAVMSFRKYRSTAAGEFSDRGLWRAAFITAVGGILATVVLTGVLEWPWSAEYHRWHVVSGTVTDTGSRLIASDTKGGGTTQRFVVTLAGVGQRACDDTRCAEVKIGDRLTLSCKREWQYAGTPGWSCGFVEVSR